MPVNLGTFSDNQIVERQITLSGSRDESGVPSSLEGQFDGSETFRFELWRGEDEADVFDSDTAVRWDPDVADNPDGIASPVLLLTLTPTDLAAIGPGTFYASLLINPGTDDISVLPDGSTIEIRQGAGSGAAIKVYCSMDDCRDVAEWIGSLAGKKTTARADLAEQRGEARKWIDRQLMARAEAKLRTQAERHGAVVSVTPIVPASGYDYGPEWGVSTIPDTTLRDQLTAYQGYLDADKLIVTEDIRRVAALYAVHRACEPTIGTVPGSTGTNGQVGMSYQDFGRRCREEARLMLIGVRGGIDTDNDGIADIWL